MEPPRRVNSRGDIIKARLFAAIDAVFASDGTIDCRVNTVWHAADIQMNF